MTHPEEDDELVGELDLLLSQPPSNAAIHVLQYPLRHPAAPPGADRQVTGAQIRPKNGRIELSLTVHPTHASPSFDDAQPAAVEKAIGEQQKLRSKPHRVAPNANFAVGRHDPSRNAFVIAPVTAVTQLRPAFDYLDDYDMQVMQARLADKSARANARGETPRKVEDPAQVQLSFRRRETERAVERRKNSHATLRQQEEGEPWVPVSFRPASESTQIKEQIFCGTAAAVVKEEDSFDVATDYEALFRVHTRHVATANVPKGSADADAFTVSALRSLPVNSAVGQIVSHARIVHFGELCRLLPDARVHEILECTRVVAACLRGCWVAKEGRREDGGKQRNASERFDASRVLILDLFRQSRVVTTLAAEKVLSSPMLISHASVKTVLKEVAEMRRGLGWELRLEDDVGFQTQHAELCRMQDADWDKRVANSREALAKSMRASKRQ